MISQRTAKRLKDLAAHDGFGSVSISLWLADAFNERDRWDIDLVASADGKKGMDVHVSAPSLGEAIIAAEQKVREVSA